jgi:hypothetical protein
MDAERGFNPHDDEILARIRRHADIRRRRTLDGAREAYIRDKLGLLPDSPELADPAFQQQIEEAANRYVGALGYYESLDGYYRAVEPVMLDLWRAGYRVEHLEDLVVTEANADHLVPLLLHWLEQAEHPGVKAAIARRLHVPWHRSRIVAALKAEYRKDPPGVLRHVLAASLTRPK